jgi:hypothetical protein
LNLNIINTTKIVKIKNEELIKFRKELAAPYIQPRKMQIVIRASRFQSQPEMHEHKDKNNTHCRGWFQTGPILNAV